MPCKNDRCPCGSGAKFKRCCASASSIRGLQARSSALRVIDREITRKLMEHAYREFLPEFQGAVSAMGINGLMEDRVFQFSVPWALHHLDVCTLGPIREHFLAHENVEGRARALLEGHQAAWTSIWKVEDVGPDSLVLLHDHITGARVLVSEKRALVRGDSLLARVVAVDGTSFISAAHPVPLPGSVATHVVRDIGMRFGDLLGADALRTHMVTLALFDLWDDRICTALQEAA